MTLSAQTPPLMNPPSSDDSYVQSSPLTHRSGQKPATSSRGSGERPQNYYFHTTTTPTRAPRLKALSENHSAFINATQRINKHRSPRDMRHSPLDRGKLKIPRGDWDNPYLPGMVLSGACDADGNWVEHSEEVNRLLDADTAHAAMFRAAIWEEDVENMAPPMDELLREAEDESGPVPPSDTMSDDYDAYLEDSLDADMLIDLENAALLRQDPGNSKEDAQPSGMDVD